jgi:PAS domain S-box-containing protein
MIMDNNKLKQMEEQLRDTEAQWRAFVENAPEIILTVDREGTILFMNHTPPGLRVDEVVGKSAYDFVEPEHREMIRQSFARVFSTGERTSHELWTRGPHGTIAWYLTHMGPVKKDGAVVAVIMFSRDITEHKRTEEALKEAHGKLQATLRAVPDLMFEVDRDGRIYDYHAPEHETLYVQPDMFLGKTVSEVLPENAAGVILQALAEADQKGWHRGATYSLDVHGGRNYFELSIDAKKETGISQKRFLALVHNITERKRAEEALWESEKQYRNLVDNSLVGIFKTNLRGDYLYVNEALARMAGYDSPADMMKESVLTRYKSEHERDFLLKTIREKGRISNFEFEFLRENGHTIRVLLSAVLDGEVLSGMIMDITERKRTEEERERLILELKEALAKVKTLSGMLPICASCKKIRNDSGYWEQIEVYIRNHSEAEFSHGLCPDCVEKLYGQYKKKKKED